MAKMLPYALGVLGEDQLLSSGVLSLFWQFFLPTHYFAGSEGCYLCG